MVLNMVATLLWIVVRASNEAEVGPSARTQEGALLERWLVQCGVRGPLYSIGRTGVVRPTDGCIHIGLDSTKSNRALWPFERLRAESHSRRVGSGCVHIVVRSYDGAVTRRGARARGASLIFEPSVPSGHASRYRNFSDCGNDAITARATFTV